MLFNIAKIIQLIGILCHTSELSEGRGRCKKVINWNKNWREELKVFPLSTQLSSPVEGGRQLRNQISTNFQSANCFPEKKRKRRKQDKNRIWVTLALRGRLRSAHTSRN